MCSVEELIQVFEKHGWPALFYFTLCLAAWRAFPTVRDLVKEHQLFLGNTVEQGTTNTENISDLVGMQDQSQRAMAGHAEAILALAESQGHKDAVEPHVREIRKVLSERTG